MPSSKYSSTSYSSVRRGSTPTHYNHFLVYIHFLANLVHQGRYKDSFVLPFSGTYFIYKTVIMNLLILTAVCILYGSANYYVAVRIFKFLKLLKFNISGALFAVIFAAFSISVLLSFAGKEYALKRAIFVIGSVWLGVLMYLLIFTAAADLIMLLPKLSGKLTDTVRLIAEASVLILTAVTVSVGAYRAVQVQKVHYTVDLEKSINPLKVVLVSDIHIGELGIETRLSDMAAMINEETPDIVCIAGDIFNNDFSAVNNPEAVADALKSIRAKYGVYACLGNHDCGNGFDKMLELIADSGINLLREEYAVIPDCCVICGRADSSPIGDTGTVKRGSFDSINIPDGKDLPVIVLDHNPANYDGYTAQADLILCGHTHKGQMFPGSLITNAMYTVDYGMCKAVGSAPAAIVTSGLGYWGPPLRIGTDSEIATIELRNKT